MANVSTMDKMQNAVRRNARISLLDPDSGLEPRTLRRVPAFAHGSIKKDPVDNLNNNIFPAQDEVNVDGSDEVDANCSLENGDLLSSWQNRVSFKAEVTRSAREMMIDREEAKMETTVQRLIRSKGTKDKALLYALSDLHHDSPRQMNEHKAQMLVKILLHSGAQPVETDSDRRTPLHHAVSKNYHGITRRLLEYGADPLASDVHGQLPYKLAVDEGFDSVALLLAIYMPNDKVRALYIGTKDRAAQMSFHDLLQDPRMPQTRHAVLDCMKDDEPGQCNIYYSILDADGSGRSPDTENFDQKSLSALHILARTKDKEVIYHDVVRLFIKRKWTTYARCVFIRNAILFLFTVFAITYSLVIASTRKNPMIYDSPLQISRAFFEITALLIASGNLFHEFYQMNKHGKEYWQDRFNWLDVLSCILLILVLPFRLLNHNFQWLVFAAAYSIWNIRGFKYAPVSRSTGAFAQIMWTILTRHFLQFIAVFLVILLTFAGSFTLVLRWEDSLKVFTETKSFWFVLYTGVRTLVEQQPIMEYASQEGYGILGNIFMVAYLFTCIVVLLNILIALLSDTYQNVQRDAQRGLELNLAWIVSRVELYGIFSNWQCGNYRKKYYQEMENITDLKLTLNQWENRPMYDSTKIYQDLNDRLDFQDLNMRSVKSRLLKQEETLKQIKGQFNQIHFHLNMSLKQIQQQLDRIIGPESANSSRTKNDWDRLRSLPTTLDDHDGIRLLAATDSQANLCPPSEVKSNDKGIDVPAEDTDGRLYSLPDTLDGHDRLQYLASTDHDHNPCVHASGKIQPQTRRPRPEYTDHERQRGALGSSSHRRSKAPQISRVTNPDDVCMSLGSITELTTWSPDEDMTGNGGNTHSHV